MKRSQIDPMPVYFDKYINKCDDVELLEAIQMSIEELSYEFIEKCRTLGDKVYAPGKWTVKDILQHIIDNERIFGYRVLAIARDEIATLPSYDEEAYAKAAMANTRTLDSLIEELKISHYSIMHLYGSFTDAMLHKVGMGFKGEYSVASAGFMLAGHQRWHFDVLREKYFPLIDS